MTKLLRRSYARMEWERTDRTTGEPMWVGGDRGRIHVAIPTRTVDQWTGEVCFTKSACGVVLLTSLGENARGSPYGEIQAWEVVDSHPAAVNCRKCLAWMEKRRVARSATPPGTSPPTNP